MIRSSAVLAVVLAGFWALALVGEIDAAAAGLGVLSTLGARALRGLPIPWTAATLLAVGGLGGAVGLGVPPAEALGALLAYLQIHGRLTRASEADDRKALLLAALMLVIGAGASRDPRFALAIGAYSAALPVALLSSGIGARGALAVSAGGALLAGLLFVAAPRGAPPPDREAIELTGFSPEVELGALDVLLDDPAVVFRAAVSPRPSGAVYWRGIALDGFDGIRWYSGSPAVPTVIQPPATFPADTAVIEVRPEEGGVLFTAGWPLSVEVEGILLADAQGGFSTRSPGRYRVVSQAPLGLADRPFSPPEPDPQALARALSLPEDLDPRIRELAASVAGEGPPAERISRISAHLRERSLYTRRPRDTGAQAPLSDFLFGRRAGHCEYFASALAVLARAQGIPARVVNGFVGGDPEAGGFTIRRQHAHSWVEFHDRGWRLADPTPGPAANALPPAVRPLRARLGTLWEERILGYDRSDQIAGVLAAGRALEGWLPGADPGRLPWRGLGLLLGGTLGVAWIGQRLSALLARRLLDPLRSEPIGPIARVHHQARELVASRGWRIPRALPPVAAARWLQERAPGDPADALLELSWLYYEVHLGGGDPRREDRRARALLERIRPLAPAGVRATR